MSGMPGRSGAKRLPLSHHLLMGTYRRDRHGELPAHVTPMPPQPGGIPHPWSPTPAERRALGRAGQRFLRAQCAAYEFSLREGTILLEAAVVTDRLAALRAEAGEASGAALRQVHRSELQWSRHLVSLLAQLRVTG